MGRFPKRSWHSFVNTENQRFVSDDALSFLSGLLVYDHTVRHITLDRCNVSADKVKERLTAQEAMAHPVSAPNILPPSSLTSDSTFRKYEQLKSVQNQDSCISGVEAVLLSKYPVWEGASSIDNEQILRFLLSPILHVFGLGEGYHSAVRTA